MGTLAQAADQLGELVAAAERLAYVAGRMGDCEALRGISCNEVEAIADVLRAINATDAVDAIIAAHASGDDEEDDQHHDQYLAYRAEHERLDAAIVGRPAAAQAIAGLLRSSRGDSDRLEAAAQHFDAIADGRA
jgi:hypothetical protein